MYKINFLYLFYLLAHMRCAAGGFLGWDSIGPGSVFSAAADRVFEAGSGFRVGSCAGPGV